MVSAKKKNLDEWLKEDQWPTPEESEQYKAERKAMEGTWLETITMTENGELKIHTWQYLAGGVQAEGNTESVPGDGHYEDFLDTHGRLKPGESHTLVRKLTEGHWVIQADDETDSAKSA